MTGQLETVGELLTFSSSLDWVTDLAYEGAGGEMRPGDAVGTTARIAVERDSRPFPTGGWRVLARGARHRRGEVVLENACTSGFDLHVDCRGDLPTFTYRWRPPARDRIAARMLRSRFHLLARAALLQYPALWLAGRRGRVPLHASGCARADSAALVTAQSGIGRSTLVLAETAAEGRATGDNLAVGDGTTVWGLVEPLRVAGGGGRRMAHGRSETPLPDRAKAIRPACVVVLVRGDRERASLAPCDGDTAARALVAGTYAAGELRRYWSLAAVLAAGTGEGPAHPAVADVAAAFADLPCFELELGRSGGACLEELLVQAQVPA